MISHLRSSGRSAAVILAVLAVARAEGQLAKTSPFLPPQGAGAAAPTAGAPLEFRGWMKTSDGILFRLRDPARKADTWVKLNEPDRTLDVIAKQHDTERNTLTIEHQGKTLTLAVRESKIVSSGSASHPLPAPATPVATNVSPAVTQSVVVNPTPADEQRRLDAVAAEVARRRALREQAAQQVGQNVQPPTFVQPPQQPSQLRGGPAMPQRGFPPPGAKSGGPGVQQR